MVFAADSDPAAATRTGRLRPGGVVLAPRVHGLRREAGRLIDELRSGTAGFQSTTLPYRAGLEFTVVV